MMLKSLHILRDQFAKLHVKHFSFTKFADPKKDFVFKKLFEKEDLLIDFINKHLPSKDRAPVTAIKFLPTIVTPPIEFKKSSIFDLLCTDSNGHKFIIEMQNAKQQDFYKRALYYTSKTYSNQLDRGGAYRDLKEVVFMAITNFVMFPNKKDYISTHCVMDTKTYENDFKDTTIVIIELPKYDESNGNDEWCDLLKNAENYVEIKSADPVIQKAYKLLEIANWNEKDFMAYEGIRKDELDFQSIQSKLIFDSKLEGKIEGKIEGEIKGKIEGEIEGKIKGEIEGKIKCAKRMKAGNVDDETIANFTGLTISEIKSL